MSIMTETEATPAPGEVAASESATVPVHRLTVDRYIQMIASGILKKSEPIFLWKGRLAEKMTKGADHNFTSTELDASLSQLIPLGWFIREEKPIQIADDGMPEPDLAVIRGANRDYRGRAPAAQDVALIIEVADSSVAVDSGEVLQTFASQSIPIYWIVNIPDRRVEVYREPTGPSQAPTYRERRFYGPGERVPVVLDGREVGTVDVSEILP